MVTPLLRALRQKHPDAELDVLCSRLAFDLLELTPGVARRIPLHHRNLPYALSLEKQRIVRELRSRGYDRAILLERAGRYRKLLERAGISSIQSFRETPFDPRQHAIVNNLNAAGIEATHLDMEVFLSDEDRKEASKLLTMSAESPRIGIHIGYGPRGKKKHQSERLKGWALENFVEAARDLAGRGMGLVFTGSLEDRRDVEQVIQRLRTPVLDLAGRTRLRVLAAVIQKLDAFVSVDSGPAHLAAAVATPLVVLWGPAIFDQVRPMSTRSPVVVLRHPPSCAPCYETPLMKTCPRNVCMEAIRPGEVVEQVEGLLRSPRLRENE
jgi:ADP-heptose:LPS heptosyltransferase